MKRHINKIINKLFHKSFSNQSTYTNCYYLNEIEYNNMLKYGSNTIKMSGNSGIGITVYCLVNDKWLDITDYNKW